MNLYTNWLHDVGKLVYIIGNFAQTAQLKKILDPADPRNRIYFKTYQEFPNNALRKVKLSGVREGILRADWLNKILERYPQMVIFLFNLGEQTQIEKVEVQLRQILRKINLFYANVLKENMKEDVFIRIIVTTTKAQAALPLLVEKINYYLKAYEKDSHAIQVQNLGRDIAKFRGTWLSYLEKNYEKKLRKLQRKLQETVSHDKKLGLIYKIAILSEIVGKQDQKRYNELINALKYKFSQITKREFTFLKYLQIREIRILADITALRFIKHRFITNTKQLPEFVQGHINFFKMRSMDPKSCHFYFYYEELIWRSAFLQQVLQVLGAADLIQLLPHSTVAQWLNGLLSYLLKLANVPSELLNDQQGKVVDLSVEHYLGRYNFLQITDADMVVTGTTELISKRKDYISKGIQLITRFKSSGLFRENQTNFLNIYLIRFYLADSKFAAITTIYNEILKIQVNRCNYFLINQLFSEIQAEMPKIDAQSRKFIYGIASLICDYFQNTRELQKYLQLFFNQQIQDIVVQSSPLKQEKTLFSNELAPEAHVFKLKKNSSIFSAKILINQQIVLGNQKLLFCELLRRKLSLSKNQIKIKFNHTGMVYEVLLVLEEHQGLLIERELDIQPLSFMRKDNSLQIQELQLAMQKKNLVWLLERNQITFEKYDSTVFYTKISQPEVMIEDVKKVYYLNQVSNFKICVKGLQGCKVSAKLQVNQDDPDGKTEFFMKKQQKMDITNTKKHEELLTGQKGQNICWIKCNKLNNKVLKLTIVAVVQKSFSVGWREKPINLKSTYTIVKEIQFQVKHLFTITKTFKQAITGALFTAGVPINKRILLSINIKVNDAVQFTQIDYHKNPRKIKYHRSNKLSNLSLQAFQSANLNLLFQINEDCSQQIELFLLTLFVNWRRTGSKIENVFLDEATTINARQDKVNINFEQKNVIAQRKKGSLFVKVSNLTTEPTNVYIMMESTQNLLRIGQKGKWQKLGAYQRSEVEFNVFCIHAGIFQFPGVRVFLDNNELSLSTANYLVHCE